MELPNYNRQLMQQLRALRKEGQFCDCTILVGNTPHPAHKLVLAASSLLFRSLLEGSDSISIDTAVVSPQEFSCLLDMVYAGRLPPGKHNFTRIIAAADSLQMFDVAVGCKNILTSLIKQSTEAMQSAPVPQESIDPQGLEGDQVQVPGAVAVPCLQGDCSKLCTSDAQREEGAPEVSAREVRGDATEGVLNTVQQGEPSGAREKERAQGGQPCEGACLESPQLKDEGAVELLAQRRDEIAETLGDIQPWVKALQTWDGITSGERLVILQCCDGAPGGGAVLQRLLNSVREERRLSAQTLLTLLGLFKRFNPDLAPLLEGPGGESSVEPKDELTRSSVQEHASKLTDHLASITGVIKVLTKAANNCLEQAEKEVVLECCRGKAPRLAVERLFDRAREGALSEAGLLKLLHEVKGSSADLAQLLEDMQDTRGNTQEEPSGVVLLRMYHSRLSELPVDLRILRQSLETVTDIPTAERECIQALLEGDGGASVFEKLLSRAVEGDTVKALSVWRLLLGAGAQEPALRLLIHKIQEEPEAQKLLQTVVHLDLLCRHKALILDTVSNVSILEETADGMEHLSEKATEFLQSFRTDGGERETVQQALERVLSREEEYALPFCQLLSMNQQTLPRLLPLVEDLRQAGTEAAPDTLPQAAADPAKAELADSGGVKTRGKRGASQSYPCQWCGRAFGFKCRLVLHRKRCSMSPESSQRCPVCSEELRTPRALQQHVAQAHGGPARKRKKQEPVACDLCDKTFAHSSGMLYHKRTEHFEQRPYACEECGAKFAANSSLKNHMRLHTGEKPFHCKHCEMSFSVAAALSYHTKKKHSEGKMYACQYCEAVFAQSIELTRHVRTHTGDKPYVCRECGKGFSQANGLSVHLQTFHNITEPYDCQKCQMSFPTLEEHRKHIQEVHPKEFYQCTECSKLFSSHAQLEKHKVVHAGGKPYSCKACHKSYQQLSGLWYHNRTTHPEVFAGQGSRPLRSLVQCKTCDKAFASAASLIRHERVEHPETIPDIEAMETQAKAKLSGLQQWKCLYCPGSLQSEEELQQHVCSEHFSQDGEAFGCTACQLTFPAQLELQEHFLSSHLEVLDDEGEAQASTSQMVIQTEDSSREGAEQEIALDQSQLEGSQQVFVALGEGGDARSSSGIVAVNMEDLLNGTVTLICEESQ